MPNQSLAVKYRPTTFSDVVEQGSIKVILENQLKDNSIKHAYLFCGGAGTGKTTCARIFANEINKHKGTPIEIDAASNNSVENVRTIIQQSRQQSLDSTYKIYIIDECHSLSNSAWQAMLKLLEEPPATAIFIFCTTDPQKIPKTILSRVQRYDFQRISQDGIVLRLMHILTYEGLESSYKPDAIEYIAKIADGGMRDAITLLDKCLAYSTELTIENVVAALGSADYDLMLHFTDSLVAGNAKEMIEQIEQLHNQGKDLRLFTRSYTTFVLDLCKYDVTGSLEYTQLPNYYSEILGAKTVGNYYNVCRDLLKLLLGLTSDVKWDTNPKALIEANLYRFCIEVKYGNNSGTT